MEQETQETQETQKPQSVTTEQSKENLRKTTLGELGNRFPIARLDAEGKPLHDQSFSFLDWDMELEEKLSKLKEDAKNTGDFVNKMLCQLVDKLCGKDFQSMKDEEKTLAISQLEFPNVMYMWMYLRVEEMGEKYNVGDVGCPNCKKLNKDFVADLNTLGVDCKDGNHPRKMEYELRKPITLEGQTKPITTLNLDISKWNVLEQADSSSNQNDAKIKRLMLESAINGVQNADGPIEGFVDVKAVIKNMKKVDIELGIKAVTENNGGPDVGVSGTCVHCNTDFTKPLDWRYDHFFGSSSL